MRLPSLALPSTTGDTVDFSALDGITVVFVYPMTGRPGTPLPEGWDRIPGARGCTPQVCAHRDSLPKLKKAGVGRLFGLSGRGPAEQKEASLRLGPAYPLVSDRGFALQKKLDLPVFEAGGETFLKRLTMIIEDGTVISVIYPVFPPDSSPEQVLERLPSIIGRSP